MTNVNLTLFVHIYKKSTFLDTPPNKKLFDNKKWSIYQKIGDVFFNVILTSTKGNVYITYILKFLVNLPQRTLECKRELEIQ